MDLTRYYKDQQNKEKMALGCTKSILDCFDNPDKNRVNFEITFADLVPDRHKMLADMVKSMLRSSGYWASYTVRKKRGEWPMKGSIACYDVYPMTQDEREMIERAYNSDSSDDEN